MKKFISFRLVNSLLASLLVVAGAHAQFTSLASFDATTGKAPLRLVQGLDGRFYGTTGAAPGTVFAVSRSGKLTLLYTFCAVNRQCTDGSAPGAGLVLGGNNFYGTTTLGGANQQGTVFRISSTGQLTTLYSFCALAKCADGAQPYGPLTWTSSGELFGTTSAAGPTKFGGEVFRLSGSTPSLTAVGVCTEVPTCSNGEFLEAPLVLGNDGNFYTTAADGGRNGMGTILKVTPSGTLTVLYNFCHLNFCTDGANPTIAQPLIQGSDGNFYGLTVRGGTGVECASGPLCGTVFKITPSGALTTLYTFYSQANCADGTFPNSLIQATDGNFYGTTYEGALNDSGSIFQLTPSGVLTTLYKFCQNYPSCPDGQGPNSIFQSTDGNLYGTTAYGGAGRGTVFRLSLGLAPFVQTVAQSAPVGKTIEILGQGLSGTTNVAFNGTSATFTVVSDTYLSATVPTGATTGFVTVTTPTGTLTSNVIFRVTN